MVAMARYTPDSRKVGTPISSANSTGATQDSGSTSQNGQPNCSVISAEEYAPSPMNAACPSESCPAASTTYIDNANSPLTPSAWTRFW